MHQDPYRYEESGRRTPNLYGTRGFPNDGYVQDEDDDDDDGIDWSPAFQPQIQPATRTRIFDTQGLPNQFSSGRDYPELY